MFSSKAKRQHLVIADLLQAMENPGKMEILVKIAEDHYAIESILFSNDLTILINDWTIRKRRISRQIISSLVESYLKQGASLQVNIPQPWINEIHTCPEHSEELVKLMKKMRNHVLDTFLMNYRFEIERELEKI